MRGQLGLTDKTMGVVVMDVDETSQAFEKGLRAGDLIVEAGQQKVSSPTEFGSRIADAKDAGRKSLLLLIQREGEPRFVALAID